jgi:flagellum-specific peptidoglycan hydrolase FlgJ
MATQAQLEQLKAFADAARVAKHIFPEMAACEAVIETGWGTSTLYLRYRNIFGQKQSHSPIFTSVRMPTTEYENGKPRGMRADFVVFPTAMEAFEARMALLTRLATNYPNYNSALHAADPEEFVTMVSRSWSTDPDRAKNCIAIYRAHHDTLFTLETA